jgi:hypothetical protein
MRPIRDLDDMYASRIGLIPLILMSGVFFITWSCSKEQASASKIMDKIIQLEEFKAEEKRINSLKLAGQKVDITVSFIDGSFEQGNDISTAFINEDFGYDESILYVIQFSRETEEILSIKSNKRN